MCVLRKKPTETRKKRWELSLEMLQIQEPPQMLSNNEIPFMFIWAIKPVVVPPELHFKQNINSQVITMRQFYESWLLHTQVLQACKRKTFCLSLWTSWDVFHTRWYIWKIKKLIFCAQNLRFYFWHWLSRNSRHGLKGNLQYKMFQ